MKSIDLDKNLAEKIKCNFDKILNGDIDSSIKSELSNKRISIDIVIKKNC